MNDRAPCLPSGTSSPARGSAPGNGSSRLWLRRQRNGLGYRDVARALARKDEGESAEVLPPGMFPATAARHSTVRTGYLMDRPCAQVGVQLLTFRTPPPNATERQLVQRSWARNSLEGMQPMSYLAGRTWPWPQFTTTTWLELADARLRPARPHRGPGERHCSGRQDSPHAIKSHRLIPFREGAVTCYDDGPGHANTSPGESKRIARIPAARAPVTFSALSSMNNV